MRCCYSALQGPTADSGVDGSCSSAQAAFLAGTARLEACCLAHHHVMRLPWLVPDRRLPCPMALTCRRAVSCNMPCCDLHISAQSGCIPAGRHGKKSGRLRRRWEKEMQRTPDADKQQWTAGLRRLQALPWRRIDVSFRGSSWSTFAHTHIQVTHRQSSV